MTLGYRESTDSWAEVLRDLRERGLDAPLRTNVAKRARVRENALYLVFKIVERLATRWRVLNGGATVMTLVLAGEHFADGILVRQPPREEVRAA